MQTPYMAIDTRHDDPLLQIAGAGPAGLAAAITLARGGRRVLVHEAASEVGHRFGRDLQGLENWSSPGDVLADLRAAGIDTGFVTLPCANGTAFDAWDRPYPLRSTAPLVYLVERGPGPDTLDTHLLRQAQSLGVEVRFGSRIAHLDGPGLFAQGPRAADVIAVGYHFDTDQPDGFWLILDDTLAPRGYAYLAVMHGRGTVKSCMFAGFPQQKTYVARTVERFRRLVGLDMRNPRFHGGVGAYGAQRVASDGVVGEQGGFQDALAGFGMRYAIASGVAAAQALLADEADGSWRRQLHPSVERGRINRTLYAALGNPGYRWLLRCQAWRGDSRAFLHWLYRPARWPRWVLPWVRRANGRV